MTPHVARFEDELDVAGQEQQELGWKSGELLRDRLARTRRQQLGKHDGGCPVEAASAAGARQALIPFGRLGETQTRSRRISGQRDVLADAPAACLGVEAQADGAAEHIDAAAKPQERLEPQAEPANLPAPLA
jgi:hypothetical protein